MDEWSASLRLKEQSQLTIVSGLGNLMQELGNFAFQCLADGVVSIIVWPRETHQVVVISSQGYVFGMLRVEYSGVVVHDLQPVNKMFA